MSAKIITMDDGKHDVHFGGSPWFSTRDREEAEATCNYLNGGDGLTKRERLIIAIHAAHLSTGFSGTREYSIREADALIADMEQQS